MKAFLIVKNGVAINDHLANNETEITIDTEKKSIFEKLHLLNSPSDYRVFDQSGLYKTNDFFKKYLTSILDITFPKTWNAKTSKREYYPRIEVNDTKKGTTYVHKWARLSLANDIKTIRYVCEDTDPEENQKVLMTFK